MKASIVFATLAALAASAKADCFSTALGYPCCSGCSVYTTDADGDWGIEGDWCGIDKTKCSGSSATCWSLPDYPCCSSDAETQYIDSQGEWGYENGNWCGISVPVNPGACWSLPDYECCPSGTSVEYEDATGKWGIVNNEWCGITNDSSSTTAKTSQKTTQKTTATTTKTDVTTDPVYNKDRKQSPYPDAKDSCGSWALVDNVCCAQYCTNIPSSEGCGPCGGNDSEFCKPVDSFCCKSGARGYDFYDIPNDFHYSRSTHFGLTFGGACGFGLYQVCGSEHNYTGEFATMCDAFCKAYPTLCQDPKGRNFRGNFAAPQGNYYSQFWGSLIGDQDNYLSCGECFEVYKVKEDGSDYAVGEAGYQPPVLLQVIDSCPCSANGKWCCGSGWDHCDEVNHFKYGCPIPEDSIHLDLSDIAMARLQDGNANGFMKDGVIPNKYRRVPCPSLGNMYLWLRPDAGPYWFAFTIVNAAGFGAMAVVEARDNTGKWVKFIRDPNYTPARPHERYGVWCTPRGEGPFDLPVALRLTDGSGEVLEIEEAIKSFDPPADSIKGYYYVDLGVNFPEIPIPDPE